MRVRNYYQGNTRLVDITPGCCVVKLATGEVRHYPYAGSGKEDVNPQLRYQYIAKVYQDGIENEKKG